jgi:hypothetical protein
MTQHAESVAEIVNAVARRRPGAFYQDPFSGKYLTRASYTLEGIVTTVLAVLIDGQADG